MSTPQDRPDALMGRKLPGHALWEQLQRRAQPLGLEFCSLFFGNQLEVKDAIAWLSSYGIKASKTTLYGFYSSMDIRLRYAALQAAASAETAKAELPADIETATRERIAQHKFELAFMPLAENLKLQLVQLQQNEDFAKGNYALKKEKLDLDRIKIQRTVIKNFLDWFQDKKAAEIASSNAPTLEKTERLGQHIFGELWK